MGDFSLSHLYVWGRPLSDSEVAAGERLLHL